MTSRDKIYKEPWFWALMYALIYIPRVFTIGIGFDFKIYLDTLLRANQLGPLAAYRADALGFSYAPLLMWLMKPLIWFDSPLWGFRVFSILNWIATFACLKIVFDWIRPHTRHPFWIGVLTLITMDRFLVHNVNFGQSNVFLFLCLLLSLYFVNKKTPVWSGLFLSLAMSFKLTPAIFLLYFACKKQYRICVWTLTFLVIGNGGAAMLLSGYQWIDLLIAYQNALSFLGKTHEHVFYNYSLLRVLLDLWSSPIMNWIFVIIAGVSTLMFVVRQNDFNQPHEKLFDWSVLLVFMVMFSPISWGHHLVVLLLPMAVFCVYLVQDPKNVVGIAIYLGCVLSMGGAINHLPHLASLPDISNQEHISGFTFSMLFLLSGLFYFYYRHTIGSKFFLTSTNLRKPTQIRLE